jgi:uroporphyrinogen decarboxylase
MTSRERIAASLNHTEPDCLAIDFGGVHTSLHQNAHRRLKEYFGLDGREAEIQDPIQQIVFPDEQLLQRFGSDVVGVYPRPARGSIQNFDPRKGEVIDEWGNTYTKPEDGFFYDFKSNVMADFTEEDLETFSWPDPSDTYRSAGMREEVLSLRRTTDKAVMVFSASWGLWENLWLQRGFEQAYIDIGMNLDFVEKFWDRMLEWNMKFWDNILGEIGDLVDVVQIGDDLGSQRGPLFNPKIYRELLKPRHTELVKSIKRKTDAKVYFHSCGDVSWAVADFIDSGIDILNPVQVNASSMDTKNLKREFGNDICFWGGGCDTTILLEGTPAQVEDEVKRRIDDMAPGGGFVFASIHNIQANTPPENIAAMYETAVRYGRR